MKLPPDPPTRQKVEELVTAAANGSVRSGQQLLPLVYDRLRRIAEHRLAALRPGQTLQATALVHEAYVRLVGRRDPGWNGRAHFIGAAAEAMRELVIERHRAQQAQKRGAGWHRESPSVVGRLADDGPDVDLVSLDESLAQLEESEPRSARLVTLRFFGGLTMAEAAEVLGISVPTAERDWRFARTWLRRQLGDA